jgi:CRISPR-associated protein Cmr3
MQYYLIKPKDPLIIRSGRPFEEIADAQAARFPPPSTVAGALRNIHARSTGKALDAQLLNLAVTGSLAVKVPMNGGVLDENNILVPKPADVQYFCEQNENNNIYLVRSSPIALAQGEGCDMPNGLLPLLTVETKPGKPVSGPNWWSIKDLAKWRKGESVSFEDIKNNGWTPTEPDIRTHIAIDDKSRNAESGKIFQTTGLTLWQKPEAEKSSLGKLFPKFSVALLAGIEGEITLPMMNLGGERRLAEIESCVLWPKTPDNLVPSIKAAKGFTLTFLTPTLFKNGWLPSWLSGDTLTGIPPCCKSLQIKLRAAALERWVPQSGWDLANKQPRAAQKMIPAGATYWFEIVGDACAEDIRALWLAHLCDDEQNNRNGFGLVFPAAYSFTF